MGQAAWCLGVSIRTYRGARGRRALTELEMWERICELFGWPQTFVTVL